MKASELRKPIGYGNGRIPLEKSEEIEFFFFPTNYLVYNHRIKPI